MLTSKLRTFILAAAGLAITGTTAFAQPPAYVNRDLRRDYARADHLRADIANDQRHLDHARLVGNFREERRYGRDLNRDQAKLDAVLRDIRRDEHGYR